MDITTFFAQFWGPIVLAIGLGMFISRSHYREVYSGLDRSAFASLTFGMLAMLLGIIHVNAHSLWGTFEEGVISLLGWALLLKGAVFVIIPGFAERAAKRFGSMKMVPAVGVVMLIAGAYLSYIGYFA
jgi:hypothetical protein